MAAPLCAYLSKNGYTVRSEVKDCDIAAVKGDELVIVEMKKTLSLALLVQAVRRQKISDNVYLAIPRPANKWKWWKESRGTQHLLRRLELGLILVSLERDKPPVEVVFPPKPLVRRKKAGSRRDVLEEISRRTGDFNTAGSTGTKLVTAYRENAIQIACYLEKNGPLSPAALRGMGTGAKTLSILHRDVYGWFKRVSRGVYAIRAHGRRDLKAYPELASHYRATMPEASARRPQKSRNRSRRSSRG